MFTRRNSQPKWQFSLMASIFHIGDLHEYNSSSPCWCTDAFVEQLRCTWRKVVHEPPTLSLVNR